MSDLELTEQAGVSRITGGCGEQVAKRAFALRSEGFTMEQSSEESQYMSVLVVRLRCTEEFAETLAKELEAELPETTVFPPTVYGSGEDDLMFEFGRISLEVLYSVAVTGLFNILTTLAALIRAARKRKAPGLDPYKVSISRTYDGLSYEIEGYSADELLTVVKALREERKPLRGAANSNSQAKP